MAARTKTPEAHYHGPENAEHELRKAYNLVIEVGTTFHSDSQSISGVNTDDVIGFYRRAFNSHRKGNRLAAERWARAVKHLARAYWSEAKIAYLEPRAAEVPFLEGAQPEEFNLHERADTTEDLINSVADHVPPGLEEMPLEMKHYLARARSHLEVLRADSYRHELLRAERIKAAHEYGRVLECMALAHEAEASGKHAA